MIDMEKWERENRFREALKNLKEVCESLNIVWCCAFEHEDGSATAPMSSWVEYSPTKWDERCKKALEMLHPETDE